MPRKQIICLANSYKHGGRCIAGLCPQDRTWIRLLGKSGDGALQPHEYHLDDGTEPRLLDLIEVDLHYALPSDCHPEDWHTSPAPWRLIRRSALPQPERFVLHKATKGTGILRGFRDRIAVHELTERPLDRSLTLVEPTRLSWWIREEKGARKYRALFSRQNVTYDFALTDPAWIDLLKLLPVGLYPHSKFADAATQTYLTISISEPFFGWHYKLAAAVVVIPAQPSIQASAQNPKTPAPPANTHPSHSP